MEATILRIRDVCERDLPWVASLLEGHSKAVVPACDEAVAAASVVLPPDGELVPLVVLSFDIKGSSNMNETDGAKAQIRSIVLDEIGAKAAARGGRQLNEAGDGKEYMYLARDESAYSLAAYAALEAIAGRTVMNCRIYDETRYRGDISFRLLCHGGMAVYNATPTRITAAWLDAMLKKELKRSLPNHASITSYVWDRLPAGLRSRFTFTRRSAALNTNVYVFRGPD